MAGKAGKLRNVTVYNVLGRRRRGAGRWRNAPCACPGTIQDGEIWVSDDDRNVQLTPDVPSAAG
ncbi:hypothetical protein ACTMU2_39810 [Cupriavidus basilensis]